MRTLLLLVTYRIRFNIQSDANSKTAIGIWPASSTTGQIVNIKINERHFC